MGRRARLVLGLLAAVEAVPELGVIYAASGRLHVLMATESARALKSHLVHIHTQTADDHATCERLRGDQKWWSCVDVTRASTARRSSGGPSRSTPLPSRRAGGCTATRRTAS